MRILVVEDTADVAEGVVALIGRMGHAVDWAPDAETGDELLAAFAYDLVLLDLMLAGDMTGEQLLRALRDRGSKIPVLILTARSAVNERVQLLDLGADDYLCKPFDFDELAARVRSLLRRQGSEKTNQLSLGGLVFDRVDRSARIGDELLALSPRELALLELLLVHRGRVVSKGQILDSLFDSRSEPTENAVEVLVGRLRRKLPPTSIELINHRGLGYQLRTVGA
ncbi:MAG: response regulator transcription factor [Sphingomicrobium sp.]